jgi:antitoxin VapB
MDIVIAKLFKNGNSQAIRLPKSFRFEGDEVLLYRDGDRIIIQPNKPHWEDFFLSAESASKDFLKNRKDTRPQKRTLF